LIYCCYCHDYYYYHQQQQQQSPQDKGVYATLKGSFTSRYINNFVDSLTVGKETTATLGGGIRIEKVAEWDGEDAAVVEEEEFSLDDIMSEEL